jgi:hypothetical protein
LHLDLAGSCINEGTHGRKTICQSFFPEYRITDLFNWVLSLHRVSTGI